MHAMNTDNRVLILDTTLRDGEQTPGVNLGINEKRDIARALARLGVDIIEAGFAASSRGDFAAIEAVCAEDFAIGGQTAIASLARCTPEDIEAAAAALSSAAKPRIHLFIASSALHMRAKLRMTPQEVLRRAVESVAHAAALCADVQFSAEDATRSDRGFLFELLAAVIEAGAGTVGICDTVGYATVGEFGGLIEAARRDVPGIQNVRLSAHCHNDLGLGVANSLEAIARGARQIEGTIGGIGERAGNAALEEIIMGLTVRRDVYGCEHGIQTRRIFRTSRLVCGLTGMDMPRNKAIVGENAFRHESGIHQHGVMADAATYEIIDPADVGVPRGGIALGKLSGRHAFEERLNQLGYYLAEEDLAAAFARFKELCDKKREVDDRDLEALLGTQAGDDSAAAFVLGNYQIYAGNRMTPTATIQMLRDGIPVTEAAIGDGPINAAYSALERITGMQPTLESYTIRAVGEGADALGEVTVRIALPDEARADDDALRRAVGRGVSTDILEASILAMIDALNRLRR